MSWLTRTYLDDKSMSDVECLFSCFVCLGSSDQGSTTNGHGKGSTFPYAFRIWLFLTCFSEDRWQGQVQELQHTTEDEIWQLYPRRKKKRRLEHVRKSGFPDIRISGFPDIRKSGFPDFRKSGSPADLACSTAERVGIYTNDIKIVGLSVEPNHAFIRLTE